MQSRFLGVSRLRSPTPRTYARVRERTPRSAERSIYSTCFNVSLHTLSSVGVNSERLGNPPRRRSAERGGLPPLPPSVPPTPSSLFHLPDPPGTAPRAPFSRGEHRKMRDIKGKIFLCPLIGGCRGNTRATSASNYFQTLRIERALPRATGIAPAHTFFRPRPPRRPPPSPAPSRRLPSSAEDDHPSANPSRLGLPASSLPVRPL